MTPRRVLRAALYARYSTDRQSESSVEDQFRVCERIADAEGFEVVARFSDAAVSGGTAQRPGYQELLAGARRREFDVIVAEDSSRLWRELSEQWRALKELADLGVHVVGYGLDTRRSESKILLSVSGAMSEAYRDEIARRTHRGLEGRARAHLPTGGRAYGYRSRQGRLQVYEPEAVVVRRIFEMFADGQSPRAIAATLNEEGVPSPGASWRRAGVAAGGKRADGAWLSSTIHGEPRKGTGILNNVRYVGRVVWGRSRWVRGASDSSRRRMTLNEAPIHEYVDESLRIVSDELWQRVKGRQALIRQSTETLRRSLAGRRGRPLSQLLSGVLTCGTCGGHFIAVDARHYGCATHKNGGAAACSNAVRLNRRQVDAVLLQSVREEILSPEAVALAAKVIREELAAARRTRRQQLARSEPSKAVRAKQAEIEQLLALVKAGALSPTVGRAALQAAEQELEAMQAAALGANERKTEKVVAMLPDLAARYRQVVDALPRTDLPDAERMQARALIHELLGGQAVVEKAGNDRVLLRTGGDLRPLVQAAVGAASNLVAGAGFEPATFGL